MLNETCLQLLRTLINSAFKQIYACESLINVDLTKKCLPVRIRAILSNAGWLQRS